MSYMSTKPGINVSARPQVHTVHLVSNSSQDWTQKEVDIKVWAVLDGEEKNCD